MNYRPARVAKLIREELSKIIARELEFGGALATITCVNVTKELGTAEVSVSVLPASMAGEVLGVLEKNIGRLQHLLLKKVNIKPMPRIRFELDRGPENAAVVEKRLLESK